MTQKTVTLGGQTSVYSYLYDPAGRLIDVTKDGAVAGHFEYDANGNRTLANGTVASYDDQDRLTSFGGAQYTYTANGELQQIVAGAYTTAYEYDVFGNLKHVDLPGGRTLDYLVDGRNRRIGKKVNGTLTQGFLYQDQLKPAAELDAAGNVVSRFVYATNPNVPTYMVKGGITYRIIVDPLGSVRLVLDSGTGQVAQRIDYDEWGSVQSDSNPGFQPFGYAGGLYDRDTGLVRFGARDYDPRIGRWTVKDPIGFAGGDTSLYAYVRGNPISRRDPRGLTQRDIDIAWIQIGQQVPSLQRTDAVPLPTGTLFPKAHGEYDPLVDIITLDPSYGEPLSADRARDLLGTLIHELLHRKYPDLKNGLGMDSLEEAITNSLFNEYQRRRGLLCP